MVQKNVTLVPLAAENREQFILDNQWVLKCGFQITEFYNEFHPDPNLPTEDGDVSAPAELFRFSKVMN